MPSGPECHQKISEHTLMHPKYKTTGFYFSLVSFVSDFFCFPVNTGTYSGALSLPLFVLLFIVHVMNWFPSPHLN